MFQKLFTYVLLLIFTAANGKPFVSMSQDLEIISKCNSSYPISKLQLNRSLIEKRFENDVNRNFKCFLNCLYFNHDWINEDGVFNLDNMKSSLSESNLAPSIAKHLLNICTETKSSDPCERSFLFTSCFWMESDRQEELDDSLQVLLSSEFMMNM